MKDDALQAFATELRAQHDTLTAAHDAEQATAEAAWAKYEATKTALTEFRAKYGRVLRAIDESPTRTRSTETITAADVAVVDASTLTGKE